MKFEESTFWERRRIFFTEAEGDPDHQRQSPEGTPCPEIRDFQETGNGFLVKAKGIHNGLHLGKSLGQIATGRVWKGVSAKRETDILLREETQHRTSLSEKALSGFCAGIGYFQGAAEKRILEIDAAIDILQNSLAQLQKEVPDNSRIAALRAARFQLPKWRLDKRAKYAAHAAGEHIGAAARFATGSMNDLDFGGMTQQRTRETLQSLLVDYQGKKAEYEQKKNAHRAKDEQKMTLLGEAFGSKPEETQEMLSEYLEYKKEMELFPKAKSGLDLLRQMQQWKGVLADETSRKEISEILKQNPDNDAKALSEILDKLEGKITDSRAKKVLLLFSKIENTARADRSARQVILDTIDSFSSATQIDLKQKQEAKKSNTKEAKEKKIQQIQDLFEGENALQEKSFCSVQIKPLEIDKKARFQVGSVEREEGKIQKFSLTETGEEKKGKMYFSVDLHLGILRISRRTEGGDMKFASERPLTSLNISNIKQDV